MTYEHSCIPIEMDMGMFAQEQNRPGACGALCKAQDDMSAQGWEYVGSTVVGPYGRVVGGNPKVTIALGFRRLRQESQNGQGQPMVPQRIVTPQ